MFSFVQRGPRARADAVQQCSMETADMFLTRSTAQNKLWEPAGVSGGTGVRPEPVPKSVS